MIKHKLLKYIAIFSFLVVFFLSVWLLFYFSFVKQVNTLGLSFMNTKNIIMNLIGPNGNYMHRNQINGLYVILYILLINIIVQESRSYLMLRYGSRNKYLFIILIKTTIFTFAFAAVIEGVNYVLSIVLFESELTGNQEMTIFSIIDLFTLFFYYQRIGVIFLNLMIIKNKRISLIITFSLLIFEFILPQFIPMFESIWLPNKDSIVFPYLISGIITIEKAMFMCLREVILMVPLTTLMFASIRQKDLIDPKEGKNK